MKQEKVVIHWEEGADARPVAMLVQVASQFESSIHIESGSRRMNAKSIMGMMSLGLTGGTEVAVEAEGSDAADAVQTVVNYLEGNL